MPSSRSTKASGGRGRGRISLEGAPPVPSLVDFAAERVRDSILVGDLAPGERVLLEDIAAELGMSSIPVREALRMIATEGLMIPVARRGYTVAPIQVKDLEETYELRLLLEPLAVRLAVPRLTSADLRALGQELELLGEAFRTKDWPSHRIHHRAFHFGIYERCDSKWLLRLTDMLWANSERYQFMTTRIRGQLSARLAEHRRILVACRKGDAELAAEVMREHLRLAGESVREFLVEHGDEHDGAQPATTRSATAQRSAARKPSSAKAAGPRSASRKPARRSVTQEPANGAAGG